jgi:hypothetical protein
MLEDMQLRGLAVRTQESYLGAVRRLAEHYGRPPDQLSDEEVRGYFLYLHNERQVASNTYNVALNGIRFFYVDTLGRAWPTALNLVLPHDGRTGMVELADIFRTYGPAYRTKYDQRMPPSHKGAMAAIEQCRTEALGGHLDYCPGCEEQWCSYHSCRNRRCPKRQQAAGQAWLAQQQSRLPPTPYFFVTFTLPEPRRRLARSHQTVLYNLLFRCSAAALQQLALDPRFVGAQLSNQRIVKVEEGQVTFRYRDGATRCLRTCTLPAERFIHRFLQHVLPKGFVKVRSYGLLAPGKRARLRQAQALLAPENPSSPHKTNDADGALTPHSTPVCPQCGQPMQVVQRIQPCPP